MRQRRGIDPAPGSALRGGRTQIPPSAKWCLYGEFTARALADEMMKSEIMHPRSRIEFV